MAESLGSPGRGRSQTVDTAAEAISARAPPRGVSPRKAAIIKKDASSSSQTNLLRMLDADSKVSLPKMMPISPPAAAPLVLINTQKSINPGVPKLAVVSDPTSPKQGDAQKKSFLADIVQQTIVLGIAIPSMGTNRQMRFNMKGTVPETLETIKRSLQPVVIPNFEQMTLFSIRGGIWLNGPHTLEEYSLRQRDRLKVIAKVPSLVSYSIRVLIPTPSNASTNASATSAAASPAVITPEFLPPTASLPPMSSSPRGTTANGRAPESFKFWKETTVGGLIQIVNIKLRLPDAQLLKMGLYYTKKGESSGKWLSETQLLLDCNITKAEDALVFREMPQGLLQEVEVARSQPIKSTREIFQALEHSHGDPSNSSSNSNFSSASSSPTIALSIPSSPSGGIPVGTSPGGSNSLNGSITPTSSRNASSLEFKKDKTEAKKREKEEAAKRKKDKREEKEREKKERESRRSGPGTSVSAQVSNSNASSSSSNSLLSPSSRDSIAGSAPNSSGDKENASLSSSTSSTRSFADRILPSSLTGRRESKPEPVALSTSTLLGSAAVGKEVGITIPSKDSRDSEQTSPRSNGGSTIGTPKKVRKVRDEGYESDSSSSAGGGAIITPLRESMAGSDGTATTRLPSLSERQASDSFAAPLSGRESRDRDRVFKKQISNFLEKISRAKSTSSAGPSADSMTSSTENAPASPSSNSSALPSTPTAFTSLSSHAPIPPVGSGVLLHQPCVDLELLYRFVKYLEDQCLDTEGLFRVSGNANFIKDLCDKTEYLQLQQHAANAHLSAALGSEYYLLPPPDPTDFKRPHTVSGAIMTLLRDATDAVIPDGASYEAFMKATNTNGSAEQKAEALRNAVSNSLSQQNWLALYLLCRLIKRICERSDVNKMNAKNLGICFGMSIIRPPADLSLANMQSVTQSQCTAIELLATNFDSIFLDPKNVYTRISTALSQSPDDASPPAAWIEFRLYAALLAELVHNPSQNQQSFVSYLRESAGIDGALLLLKLLSQPYLPREPSAANKTRK